jgi:G:T-mismatch repair DNA endonuclease (very short patch repair protein)
LATEGAIGPYGSLEREGREIQLRTTDEHPFWVEGRGWTRADSLVPGSTLDTLGGPAMVLALSFTGERTTVHNISVAGNPNYFVGPDGVWVHNCSWFGSPSGRVVERFGEALIEFWYEKSGSQIIIRELVNEGEAGMRAFLQLKQIAIDAAREVGAKSLRIMASRVSGANPGRANDMVIDVAK